MTISRTQYQLNSKLPKLPATIDYRLMVQFEELRKQFLSQKEMAPKLGRTLAYWALPTDRLLPMFFMQRTLRELIDTPFEELCAAPGIGNKKIGTLISLLQRAAAANNDADPAAEADEEWLEDAAPRVVQASTSHTTPPSSDRPAYDDVLQDRPLTQDPHQESCFITERGGRRVFHTVNLDVLPRNFDPSQVSESAWARWRQIIARFGLQNEILGRFARSLQEMPRVIWHVPFENYLNVTLSELRSLRTHGEKRVRVIIETFAALQAMLTAQSSALQQAPQPITIRVIPRFVYPIEDWLTRLLHWRRLVNYDRFRRCFVAPMLEQLHTDVGSNVVEVVRRRLNLEGAQVPVRQMAKELGVTRARIYQLLAEVGEVINVRWPEGAWLVKQARTHVEQLSQEEQEADRVGGASLFLELAELCFPTRPQGEELEDGEQVRGRDSFNFPQASSELSDD